MWASVSLILFGFIKGDIGHAAQNTITHEDALIVFKSASGLLDFPRDSATQPTLVTDSSTVTFDESRYLGGRYEGRTVWRIEANNVSFNLFPPDSAASVLGHSRGLVALVDMSTSQLLLLYTTETKLSGVQLPERVLAEPVLGVPKSPPAKTFEDALRGRIGHDISQAVQIIGNFSYTRMPNTRDSIAVWSVLACGITPVGGGRRQFGPGELVDEMTVIDALSGEPLYTITTSRRQDSQDW
jgi:hypothetical protein